MKLLYSRNPIRGWPWRRVADADAGDVRVRHAAWHPAWLSATGSWIQRCDSRS